MFRLRRRAEPEPASPEQADSRPASDATDAEALYDERLIRAAQAGNLPSFNALVSRHERAIYGLCLRMLGDVDAAEDATQDTFLKAWSSLDSFRGGLVRPWLLRIAANRCYDILRARTRRPADSLDALAYESEPAWTTRSPDEHPEAFATRAELSAHLERALRLLPEDQRLAVILADIHGHPYEEIAEITGVAVGTVKSRISRARARLRDLLRDDPASRELFDRYARLSED